MTRFRTVAPTPIDFAVTAGAAVRDPEGYVAFWDGIASACSGSGFSFDHAAPVEDAPRYGTLRADSLERPLQVISGELSRSDVALDVPDRWADLWDCVGTVSFQLHDHNILMVGLDGEVSRWLGAGTKGTTARLDELQEGVIALTGLAATEVAARHLVPVLDVARRRDPKSDFIDWADDEWHPVSPRWVSRSLVLDLDEPLADVMARHWLADIGDTGPIEAFLRGETTHVQRWLNYVHAGTRPDAVTTPVPGAVAAWRAMHYAQFFYAALDLVDDRLTTVLAETTRGRRAWELAELTERLRSLSHRAELVMLHLQDLRKYVTRAVRTEMDHILEVWTYADLVEEPVRFKISICDRRLEELAAGRQARAGTVTDVILLGIGVTSVLATALAVTDFGRTVATDPDQAGFGSTTSGLTEWFASQPADAILISSVVLSALLVVLFLAVRRNGPS